MANPAHNPDALTQALAEPSRRAILDSLRVGPKSVTELVAATGLKQPNVSNHLTKMRVQNIVRAERLGRNVYYGIALPIADLLLGFHEFTRETLDREQFAGGDLSEARCPARAELEALTGAPPSAGALPNPAWRDAFFHSILSGHEDRAQALVHEMLAHRVSLPVIYTEVFEWSLNRVGELYQEGITDEAHEHMASELTERMMARVTQFYTPVARCRRRAVLGCVAGNWHVVGLRMLSDALRVQGWETLFLGANVPTASFLAMANSLRPDLVTISCGMEVQAAELHQLVDQLDASRKSTAGIDYLIMVGGRYVNTHPEVVQQLPADMTARNLTDFMAQVETEFANAKSGRAGS